ncbi:MAG: hypothetical protein AABZ08_11650 [Planctomycetota bacterium]
MTTVTDDTPTVENTRRPPSRRRALVAFIITIAGVCLFGVCGLETALRVFVPITDCYWYFWDPTVGPRIKPNQEGRRIKGKAVDCTYRINAQGWNNAADYVYKKPTGSKRVCIVGDSQIESLQVNPDQAMYQVAQAAMSRPDRPVEWYSFGNSGWGTNTEYEIIRHYCLDYQPDLVILLFVQNDPFDTSPYVVDVSPFRPTYYLGEQAELVLMPPSPDWKPNDLVRLASYSGLFRYFMFQRQLYDRLKGIESTRAGIGGLPLMAEASANRAVTIPGLAQMTFEQRQIKTWELTEKLLAATQHECNRRGARFAMVFRGWTEEIDASIAGKPFIPLPKKEDPYCLVTRWSEMGREMVAPMAQRLGIPYLDLTDALAAQVVRTGKPHVFVDDMHFNRDAHEAAGKAMAAWVEGIWSKDATQK